jgi:uncharacterized delta-60 repeat protein
MHEVKPMSRSPFGRSMFASARRTRSLVAVAGALAVVCALPTGASAAPAPIVQVDPTFGHLANGTVIADHGQLDSVNKVLHQTDGKILTVATALDNNGNSTIIVSRYLSTGALDSSYGTGGSFTRPLNATGGATDAVLQSDGKLVVVGWNDAPSGFLVLRLRTDGTLDPAFVTAHPTTTFPGTRSAQAFGVELSTGGTIVVAGRADEDTAIARFLPTGALDATFSGDGLLTHDFGGPSEAEDVAVQPDGRIVVAGFETPTNGTQKLLVARFTAVGTIDATYGSGGRVATAGSPLQSVQAVLLQGTKAVVSGVISVSIAGLSRYNANGTLDTTFGTAGTTRIHGGDFTRLTALAADGSGRLISVGQSAYSDNFPDVPSTVSLFRFSANGAPDPGFGCFGSIRTELLGNGAGRAYNAAAGASATIIGNDIVVGGDAVSFNATDLPPTDALIVRYDGDNSSGSGYGLLRRDGGTSAFGSAPACGSTAGLHLNQPIVGIAYDHAAPGNWTVASDGGVFTFGAAKFLGSMGAVKLNQPVVGMAATPDGKGYWLVASDGGIFAFGTAGFYGSMGAVKLNQPVVGMTATKDGKGYWLVASDGGVFSFGSARFAGSTGNMRLNKPVVGIAADPDGSGYWIVATDGGVFSFDATFKGSTGNIALAQPIVGIAADPDGSGYWMAATDGGLFAFDAKFSGSNGATPFPIGSSRSTIAIAATP